MCCVRPVLTHTHPHVGRLRAPLSVCLPLTLVDSCTTAHFRFCCVATPAPFLECTVPSMTLEEVDIVEGYTIWKGKSRRCVDGAGDEEETISGVAMSNRRRNAMWLVAIQTTSTYVMKGWLV